MQSAKSEVALFFSQCDTIDLKPGTTHGVDGEPKLINIGQRHSLKTFFKGRLGNTPSDTKCELRDPLIQNIAILDSIIAVTTKICKGSLNRDICISN